MAVPTFAELMYKIEEINSDNGFVDNTKYYNFSNASEEQKFRWTSNFVKESVRHYMQDPDCNNKNLIKLFASFLNFNQYEFVKKLNDIVKGSDLFCFMIECRY